MKSTQILYFLVLFSLLMATKKNYGQNIDSLLEIFVESYDSSGLIVFKPQTLEPSDPINIFSQYFSFDEHNTMEFVTDWTEEILEMHHYLYQQKYKDLRIEGAEYLEHAGSDGFFSIC